MTLSDDIYKALYADSTENVYLSEDDKPLIEMNSNSVIFRTCMNNDI